MRKQFIPFLAGLLFFTACSEKNLSYQGLSEDLLEVKKDIVLPDTIVYHKVRVDENGNILPWYSTNPGEAYDFVLNRVWNFWKNMEHFWQMIRVRLLNRSTPKY